MNTIIQPAEQLRLGRTTGGNEAAAQVQGRNVWGKVGNVTLSTLKWLGIALLTLLVAVLVVVSLIWGPTPLYLALPLAAIWLALVGLLALGTAHFGRWRTQVSAVLGFFALGLLTVITSQLSAYTPAIVDAQGRPVPGSIATLETVDLNGSEQWISIRGKSTHNPVLLWLSGGPGGSQLATERYHLAGLEDRFIVVNWEQPGAGKSYDAVRHSQLTTERYISDAYALVQHLKARFGVERVYLVGESWGSALGIWLAQRYPEQFYALAGTGVMVDFMETEAYDYNFAMQLSEQRGDIAKLNQLRAQGPPPYYGSDATLKQANYIMDGFNYMNSDPAIDNSDGFNTFTDLLSPEYGLYDKVNWARGILDSGSVMFPQLWKADVDFRRDAPSLNVPAYFLIGRHDVNAPPSLAEEYYRMLQAPHKEWVWFERSGHNPWVTESKRFVDVIVNKMLTDMQK
jgi:pimeloyl-ACP methyl ester carboxylesterase